MEIASQETFPNLRFILSSAIIKVGCLVACELGCVVRFFSLMVNHGLNIWLDFYFHYL